MSSINVDFPGSSDSKVSAYNVGDLVSIPGWGNALEKEMATPLQYSCLENPMDGGIKIIYNIYYILINILMTNNYPILKCWR